MNRLTNCKLQLLVAYNETTVRNSVPVSFSLSGFANEMKLFSVVF